jgi:hypothetical protein
VAGRFRCFTQSAADAGSLILPPGSGDLMAHWQEVPETAKPLPVWETFLRHVGEDAPYLPTLVEGAKACFADLGHRSTAEQRWMDAGIEALIAPEGPATGRRTADRDAAAPHADGVEFADIGATSRRGHELAWTDRASLGRSRGLPRPQLKPPGRFVTVMGELLLAQYSARAWLAPVRRVLAKENVRVGPRRVHE